LRKTFEFSFRGLFCWATKFTMRFGVLMLNTYHVPSAHSALLPVSPAPPVPAADPEPVVDSMYAVPPVSPAPPVPAADPEPVVDFGVPSVSPAAPPVSPVADPEPAADDSSPDAAVKASGSQSYEVSEVDAVAVPSSLPRFVYILLGVLAASIAFAVYALLQTVVEKQLVDSKNAALGPNFELAVIKTEASINAQFDKVLNDPFNEHFDLPKMVRSVKEKEEAIFFDQFRSYEAQRDLWQTVSYITGKIVGNIEKQVAEKQRGKFFIFYCMDTSIYFVITLCI
jgi:hypothetical protein